MQYLRRNDLSLDALQAVLSPLSASVYLRAYHHSVLAANATQQLYPQQKTNKCLINILRLPPALARYGSSTYYRSSSHDLAHSHHFEHLSVAILYDSLRLTAHL